MKRVCAGSMHRCQIGASPTPRCQHRAKYSSTASLRRIIGQRPVPALLLATRWSCAPPKRHAERSARPCNRHFCLHTAQAGKAESETSTDEERQETLPPSSHDSFWSASSMPVAGLPMPFGLLLGLASAGALETAYLTASKLANAPVACPLAGTCETVLSSDYAQLYGIPLSSLGLLTYTAVGVLAFVGLRSGNRGGNAGEPLLRQGLLGGAILLASTSCWLMFILFTRFPGDSCAWCLASALLSLSILATTTRGFSSRELREVAAPGVGLACGTLLALVLLYKDVNVSSASAFDLPYAPPTVTHVSEQRAVELAKRLKAAGAKMYGAFWCSHCFDQKQDFGKEAMADFPYVECYPDGFGKGAEVNPVCTAAGLEGFPTWIIGDQMLSGEQTFDQLDIALSKVNN